MPLYDKIVTKNGITRFRKDRQYCGEVDVPEETLAVLTLDNIVDENGMIVVDNKNEGARKEVKEETEKLERKDELDESGLPQDQAVTAEDLSDIAVQNEQTTAAETTEPLPEDVAKQHVAPLETAVPKVVRGRRKAKDLPELVSEVPQSRPGMGFPRVNGYTVDLFDGETPYTHVRYVKGVVVPLSAENYKLRTDAEIEARLAEMGKATINFRKIEAKEQNYGVDPVDAGDLSEDAV